MTRKTKALILAAGFGSRLGPITQNCPKPLLPFFGVPLLYILLEKLAHLEIEEIFVNGHHLSHQIRDAILRYTLDIPVRFCLEEPKILGTAGAISAIRKELLDYDLLVINGDIVSDINLGDLLQLHRQSDSLATMGLLEKPAPSKTLIWCNDKQIQSIGGTDTTTGNRAHSFTCAQVLSPSFHQKIPNGPCEIIPIYKTMLQEGRKIAYHCSQPFWFDIGSPLSYFEAHNFLFPMIFERRFDFNFPLDRCWKKLGYSPLLVNDGESIKIQGNNYKGPFFSPQPFDADKAARLGPFVFNQSSHCIVDNKTCISNSLILPGSHLRARDCIDSAIVGKDFQIDLKG